MDFVIALWAAVGDTAAGWNLLPTIVRVAVVILGINALIVVHEWGHYIVARMCGVRCDKFYIWFDAWGFRFFRFKWGDTEFGLGWLPLGGYVKMFGQEDNPGAIQAEIESARAKAAEQANSTSELSDAKEENDQHIRDLKELEKALYAPDSYLAKSVPQRMAIISAGVVMNIFFAIVCATVAALMGFPETTSRIGVVLPGTPAWKNGLRPGDKIVEMNGKSIESFSQIQVNLLDGKETVIKVQRSGMDDLVSLVIKPELTVGGMTPTIGISPATSLELAKIPQPYRSGTTVLETAISAGKTPEEELAVLQGGDRLLAMNGKDIESPSDYEYLSRKFIAEPVTFRFGAKPAVASQQDSREITLAPTPMKDTGLRLTMGEIVAIQPGSPADKAELQATIVDEKGEVVKQGDVLYAINNDPIKDPIKLPYQFLRLTGLTLPGEKPHTAHIMLSVIRQNEQVEVPVTISSDAVYSGILSNNGMLAIGQLGVSYKVRAEVGGIDTSTSFEQGGNPLGKTITQIKMLLPSLETASEEQQQVYSALARLGHRQDNVITLEVNTTGTNAGKEVVQWFANYVNHLPEGTSIEFTVVGQDVTAPLVVSTKVRETLDAFLVDRGLLFGYETTTRKSNSLGEAVVYGWNKTFEMMGLVFSFLQNIGTTVSTKALGGPVMIVNAAWATTGSGDGLFLLFLCMISANLAVVNFLPIPVLDGGHMVFLLYEGIFRRPPPETFLVIMSYMGLFLLLGLMFWVIGLDICRLFSGM